MVVTGIELDRQTKVGELTMVVRAHKDIARGKVAVQVAVLLQVGHGRAHCNTNKTRCSESPNKR